jgi:PPM family protein phosphatase
MRVTGSLKILPSELVVTASIRSDAGCIRATNEDLGRYICPGDRTTLASRGRLAIIADGMGGHASGEIAANMAVEIINERYYSQKQGAPQQALHDAIQQANLEIFAASAEEAILDGMGTTLVALVIVDRQGFCAHVGDSRLYRMREQRLELLTTDHSQVMQMVSEGVITLEQARVHEDRNVILRAVGTQSEVETDISEVFDVEPGDLFLLCSDGLSDMVTDDEIASIVASEPTEYTACERLIEAAKANGGYDNVTVGVIGIGAVHVDAARSVRITREVAMQEEPA